MEDGTAEYNWLEAVLVNHHSNSAATFLLRHQADEMMIGSPLSLKSNRKSFVVTIAAKKRSRGKCNLASNSHFTNKLQ
jgi:hypothetical protein